MMNIALLTAAGRGTRMHSDIPKQFLHIANKPVILYTMEAFQKHPQVDAIMVVTLDSWREVIAAYAKQYHISKLRWTVPGGETGQDSIRCGLEVLANECSSEDAIIIHDGNRPLVSEEIISGSLATYKAHGSAVTAIPCIEAIYKSQDGESSDITLDRREMLRTQTPHTYPLGKLLWAHQEAERRGIKNTTATCTLMTQLGERVYFSRGAEKNFKLTTWEDVEIFRALLQRNGDNVLL